MNRKRILYSCSSWLAYEICQRYYGELHYAWCAPYFDAFSAFSPHNSVPPSSSPRDIYWALKKDVEAGDLHSAKIRDIRKGIQLGAAMKHRAGIISIIEYREIIWLARRSLPAAFKPLMLVVPMAPVASRVKSVAIGQRAHPLSEEYIIEELPRALFDAVER